MPTVPPPNAFDSGAALACGPEKAAASLPQTPSGDAAADIPDDLKERFLAAIEADYRVHVVDLEKLEAALYAPPDIRGESFEEYIAKLRELSDNDQPPLFIQQQMRA